LKGPILVHRLLTSLIIITFLHILSFIDFLANLNSEKGLRAINEQEEVQHFSRVRQSDRDECVLVSVRILHHF